MSDLLIRDVEDDVVQRLRRNAELNHRSPQQELWETISHGAKIEPSKRRRAAEAYLARFDEPVGLDLTRLVKEDRR